MADWIEKLPEVPAMLPAKREDLIRLKSKLNSPTEVDAALRHSFADEVDARTRPARSKINKNEDIL